MQDWMLPHITDYWDERVEAIERLSRVIAAVPEAERPAQLSLIGAAVLGHANALTDTDLVKFTVAVVEDLYKAASKRTYLDEPLLQYLVATCGPFFDVLTRRGYMVHSFIDNTYDRLDGPVIGFPMWYRPTGLFYICPQQIACTAFEKDKPPEEWPPLVAKYIDDARVVADKLVDRCHAEGRHFVYLDIDATDFAAANKPFEKPGLIYMFRNEAPIPGSRIAVRLPTGPRTGQAPTPAPTSASA